MRAIQALNLRTGLIVNAIISTDIITNGFQKRMDRHSSVRSRLLWLVIHYCLSYRTASLLWRIDTLLTMHKRADGSNAVWDSANNTQTLWQQSREHRTEIVEKNTVKTKRATADSSSGRNLSVNTRHQFSLMHQLRFHTPTYANGNMEIGVNGWKQIGNCGLLSADVKKTIVNSQPWAKSMTHLSDVECIIAIASGNWHAAMSGANRAALRSIMTSLESAAASNGLYSRYRCEPATVKGSPRKLLAF